MKIFPAFTLRAHLVALVFASVLPLILFAGWMILDSHRVRQAEFERGLLDTARALSAALDREFAASIQAVKVLGTSQSLNRHRLPEFYEEMKLALSAYGPAWHNLVLADRTGQQLINLRRPFGAPLPRRDLELIDYNLRIGDASISNVFSGPLTGAPTIVMSVPVSKDGEIKYLLRAGYNAAGLLDLLSQQKLPPGWLATIIDRNQVIAARSREPEKFLGKRASDTLADRARQFRETSWRGTTLDGEDVVEALTRSEFSGWMVGLAVPVAAVDAPLKRSLALTGAAGLVRFAIRVGLVSADK